MKNWGMPEWEIGRWFSTFGAITHLTFRWDSPVGDGKATVARYPCLREATPLRERRFIMVISFEDARHWYPQSAFDSYRNKLQSDLGGRGRKRKGEEKRGLPREEGKDTHVDIKSNFRRLSGICTTTTTTMSVQIDVFVKCNWLRNSAQFR